MEQQRQTSTKRNLREALIKLLRTHSADEITVSMLTREAGINRATFYAYYQDKNDLLEAQIEDFIQEISDILLSKTDMPPAKAARDLIPYSRVLDALRSVYDNRELGMALVAADSEGKLKDRFKDLLWQLIMQEVERAPELTPTFKEVPEPYAREIALAGIMSVIWQWVGGGCQEAPEEIARILDIAKCYPPYELLQ